MFVLREEGKEGWEGKIIVDALAVISDDTTDTWTTPRVMDTWVPGNKEIRLACTCCLLYR